MKFELGVRVLTAATVGVAVVGIVRTTGGESVTSSVQGGTTAELIGSYCITEVDPPGNPGDPQPGIVQNADD